MIKEQLDRDGFVFVADVFDDSESSDLISLLSQFDNTNSAYRISKNFFAIRQFFQEIPGSVELIFNRKLTHILNGAFQEKYFVVKSIYFDKPQSSNWFVSYHQDLTISVDYKIVTSGYSGWTIKNNCFSVQLQLELLQDNFTIRIHLDDTNENNGALKVIPGSHLKGIIRPETISTLIGNQVSCNVAKGGIMFMKPLLLHSSDRTINKTQRRVFHIEFSRFELPNGLTWAERLGTNASR